ncbi:hypothetical protein [Streptomyces sp. NPDC048462]|uniref:hypothetical protein n=1 Tax=Streptomyces sp. NPDC048462 TaxID=3365555 RepID=UPI00372030D1
MHAAALASYGWKLRAVFPPAESDAGDALRHCAWSGIESLPSGAGAGRVLSGLVSAKRLRSRSGS